MKLTLVAKSNREVFAGIDKAGEYVVLSLDDSRELELGDVLSAEHWDDRNGFFVEVRNVTRGEKVNICIENWSLTKNGALELLMRLNRATEIVTLKGY